MTQKQLAELMVTTGNTVSNWENGTSNPDVEMVARICEYLNVSPNSSFPLNEHVEVALENLNLTQA